jgi:hypothetical protein
VGRWDSLRGDILTRLEQEKKYGLLTEINDTVGEIMSNKWAGSDVTNSPKEAQSVPTILIGNEKDASILAKMEQPPVE